MFIQEQMPALTEMNEGMQDFIVDVVATHSPITAVYTSGLKFEIAMQMRQWYDLLNSLIFV